MADYYADSSVLVKRHVTEDGTAWVQSLTAPAYGHLILASELSKVELYSALNRRVREQTLSSEDYRAIVADFAALCNHDYRLLPASQPVIERACTLIEQYPLRAYDAIQLATALIINETFQQQGYPSIIFLSADQRLVECARTMGLSTDNPNHHEGLS